MILQLRVLALGIYKCDRKRRSTYVFEFTLDRGPFCSCFISEARFRSRSTDSNYGTAQSAPLQVCRFSTIKHVVRAVISIESVRPNRRLSRGAAHREALSPIRSMLELAGREPIHGHQLFHGALQFSMLSSTSAPHTEQLLPQQLATSVASIHGFCAKNYAAKVTGAAAGSGSTTITTTARGSVITDSPTFKPSMSIVIPQTTSASNGAGYLRVNLLRVTLHFIYSTQSNASP